MLDDYLATNTAIRSPHTERLIRTSIKHFAAFLDRIPEVCHFTDKQIAGYIQHRRKLGRAEATIEREVAKLMSLWRYAAAKGFAPPHTIRLKKAKVDTPVAFLKWEVRALFRAAKKYRATIGGAPGNIVMLSILGVCFDTAERIGALEQVEWSDVNLRGRWITIRSRKNGGRTLTRELRRSTAKQLRLLAECGVSKPFGFVHRGTLYHHLENLLKAAGLPTDRRHKFHCLRRSHASYVKAAGGDARESLDHADEAMTRVRYYDPRILGAQNVLRFLFHPFSWWERMLGLFGW